MPTIGTLAAAHVTGQSLCPDAMSQCTQCHRQAWEAASLVPGLGHGTPHSLPPSFIHVTNQQEAGVGRAWSNGVAKDRTGHVKD